MFCTPILADTKRKAAADVGRPELTRGRVRRAAVVVRPVVEVQLPGEQCGENVVRVVRITTRHTFQINRGARYRTPGREIFGVWMCVGHDERRSRRRRDLTTATAAAAAT